MLGTDDIERIRESFAFLLPMQEDAAEAFYDALFQGHPQVRAMFPADMTEQTGKLWSVLVMAVDALDDLGRLHVALRDMGARHVDYGVEEEHYALVADMLIDTIALAMGPTFTDGHRASWQSVMGLISAEMIAGARAVA